jgi:hypothetical protein
MDDDTPVYSAPPEDSPPPNPDVQCGRPHGGGDGG